MFHDSPHIPSEFLINDGDDKFHEPVEHQRHPGSWRNMIFKHCSIILAVLLTSTICLFIANYHHLFSLGFFRTKGYDLLNSHQQPKYSSCGNTSAEARARGCSFDLLSFAWQTPECYDESLLSAFLAHKSGGWAYYTDSNATEKVSPEVAALGERDLYVTWEYHLVHCTFMWMQMHRAFSERGYIDSHLDSWEHTKHCQKVVLANYTMETVNVEGKVRYPECRSIRGEIFGANKSKDYSLD